MTDIKKPSPLSPEQARALKKKLRSLRWQPEAVMREIVLIQKLRRIAESTSSLCSDAATAATRVRNAA